MADNGITSISLGKLAEESACRYLTANGLKLIEKNYKCRRGEIDLVMQDKNSIVFIEVRYRRNDRFGSGAESVISSKQQKLIMTAMHYLQTHKHASASASRFDVVSIQGRNGKNDIEWIQNAFQA
jgi:putative endonuclease